MKKCVVSGVVAALVAGAGVASAQVQITEWMYSGLSGEYIEITNTSGAPVNMAGWSFDDDSRLPGVFDLSGFGTLAPGESALITEILAADLRTAWGLSASVKVLGSNLANLGRNDEINIFNGVNLVDRLTFGDQNIVGSIRTQNRSGITLPGNLGANNVLGWFFSTVGDAYGTYTSANGDIGNPGIAIPAPGALALVGVAGLAADAPSSLIWRLKKRF